jgi:hypothetical protein
MSDKKIIDVEAGDRFEFVNGGTLYQYRDDKCRPIRAAGAKSRFYDAEAEIDGYYVGDLAALGILNAWGYTITPSPKGEKAAVVKEDLTTDELPPVDAAWASETESHIARIDGRVDDLAATVKRLVERVAKLEAAPTPAKVRVVAPTPRVWADRQRRSAATLMDDDWRAALAAAGVEVKEVNRE